ncbi:hypothetical protein LCIT_19580 [Leuconostoc citreum]|uniref:Uncharacterized protein n=1 Tax=Leuconostoc citreum TaxID=33964 RepID=A0A5A5U3V8_LEUCI|nr:hypothetical protein LCIT_19580 [Leuconostoc citreum]GDZ86346.1 hypothetical protein LCTS_15450 [Leuconostoc citreum]
MLENTRIHVGKYWSYMLGFVRVFVTLHANIFVTLYACMFVTFDIVNSSPYIIKSHALGLI